MSEKTIGRIYNVIAWLILALSIIIIVMGAIQHSVLIVLLGTVFVLDWVSDRL